MNKYIGHALQVSGTYEYRLTGGKGDGMRMLRVRNGKGLDFEISLDRCADITLLSVDGVNMSYITPCGYVHPSYYEMPGLGFLKSFTGGFVTTCGLTAVGRGCTENGEELPLHGTIANTPSEQHYVEETEDKIIVKACIRDASLFSHQLMLERTYEISKVKNSITLSDCIINIGNKKSRVMILYHCNMGYPLLSENARLYIPSHSVTPVTEHAANDIENALIMEKPQSGYEERCYFYDVEQNNGVARCGIFNPDIQKGMIMSFDKSSLGWFTEWKMMGEHEYVLGLEPGNCRTGGLDVTRDEDKIKFLNPGEKYITKLNFEFVNNDFEI